MAGTFGATSTTDEVLEGVNLSGKRILVTGVSAGLGVETARTLAAHGAQVVGAARNLNKAMAATEHVRAQAANGGGLELVELDLASLASVRACADALVSAGRPVDLVIANAGVMACPKSETSDGFETQFGTNHLGHFVLVNRIASLLKPGSRLVNLSSSGHRFSDVDLDDPNFERTPYTEVAAYGRSKTANILFAVEFDRRHRTNGVRATAVHPGGIQTELGRHMKPGVIQQMINQINEINAANAAAGRPAYSFKTIPQGAATSVWSGIIAAADDVGGRYCEDCHAAELAEDADVSGGVRGGVRAYAVDPDRAKKLWAKSEEMVGERF
jgi:NAD(P)-dependent dehydrogenase (short-subunit alcohol dehydrogenase family)